MKTNTKILILLCVVIFILVAILTCIISLLGTNDSPEDISYEMRNVIENDILNLETLFKKNNIISKEVERHNDIATGEYWVDSSIWDFQNGIYMNIGFTYEQVCCEVYIVYQKPIYTVNISIGMTDMSSLSAKSKEGITKILNILNSFCETNSFSGNALLENYRDTYFINNYESNKYEADFTYHQNGITEMCSYETVNYLSKDQNEKEVYTYYCSKNSDGGLYPCQIAITYDRIADEALVLAKGGDK